jgi:hypothetical protein
MGRDAPGKARQRIWTRSTTRLLVVGEASGILDPTGKMRITVGMTARPLYGLLLLAANADSELAAVHFMSVQFVDSNIDSFFGFHVSKCKAL